MIKITASKSDIKNICPNDKLSSEHTSIIDMSDQKIGFHNKPFA